MYLIVLLLILCTIPLWRFLYYALVGKINARKARPFTQYPENPTLKVLVLGDSTALGTGVSNPAYSIPGRLGSEFPNAQIENRAKNGMRTKDLLLLLKTLPKHSCDIILIHIGGMDIMQLRSLQKTTECLDTILTLAKEIASKGVVLVMLQNLTFAPMLWFPIGSFYNLRVKKARTLFTTIATKHHVHLVDLYHETKDPLVKNGVAQYWIDRIHPNDQGYEIWYEHVRPIFARLLS